MYCHRGPSIQAALRVQGTNPITDTAGADIMERPIKTMSRLLIH